ncbi:hypothetical protein XELAEV_18019236mg [Xenopus laevis]|uniref:Ig-like domain-containing protein n=1 Tax=Xenopus laevis TaxID=8355 RepID=A0A974HUB1_XENLA|nr:hypothetical protein XELAEV_18019236mg [Xenopus laevis]
MREVEAIAELKTGISIRISYSLRVLAKKRCPSTGEISAPKEVESPTSSRCANRNPCASIMVSDRRIYSPGANSRQICAIRRQRINSRKKFAGAVSPITSHGAYVVTSLNRIRGRAASQRIRIQFGIRPNLSGVRPNPKKWIRCIPTNNYILASSAVWGRPGQYCADQPAGVEVFAGDSVTFPCSFVFPRTLTGITNRTIVFQAGNISYCGDRIYNSRYGNTTQEYQGRVSLVGDPQAQNGTITLTSVRTSDRKNFCCRVQLLNQNTIIEQWQNGLGTRLTVRVGENKMTMHQPPFISALVGDTVTIPCHFSINSKKEIQKKSVSSVQWRFGQSPSCGTVIYNSSTGAVRREDRERISVAGEGGASILIKRVTTNDRGWYCCGAQVTGDGQVYTTQRERGTNLTITGKTDQMKIKQPKEVTFTNSSTISCNFTLPEDEDPLWLGIYWMFGNPREGFAYHPHPELIHPRYRGKTRLVGQSDLYLEEVIGMDNTNFYCRVAMRLCNDTQQNTIETLLEEGAGTLLRVNADPSDQTKIIAASVVSAIILILLLFIILCLVKHKGK